MKIMIVITVLAFFGVVLIILQGLHDASEFEETVEKSLNNVEDEEIFSEFNTENEFGPEQLDIDKTLNVVSLRNKLQKIEKERETKIDSFDFDNREDGR